MASVSIYSEALIRTLRHHLPIVTIVTTVTTVHRHGQPMGLFHHGSTQASLRDREASPYQDLYLRETYRMASPEGQHHSLQVSALQAGINNARVNVVGKHSSVSDVSLTRGEALIGFVFCN